MSRQKLWPHDDFFQNLVALSSIDKKSDFIWHADINKNFHKYYESNLFRYKQMWGVGCTNLGFF